MREEKHRVTICLSNMFARGTLIREQVLSGHKGRGGTRKQYAYTVPAKFTEFELRLPSKPIWATPPKMENGPQQAPASKVKKMLDGMAIAEARELHQTLSRVKKLHEIFSSAEMAELQGALGILFKP